MCNAKDMVKKKRLGASPSEGDGDAGSSKTRNKMDNNNKKENGYRKRQIEN